jgi:hypothetical protein
MPYKIHRSIVICCVLLAVNGCSRGGFNLDPAAPTVSPAYTKNTATSGTLTWLVAEAGNLAADYDSRYISQARFQAFPIDIPIIGLAIATAGNFILGGSTTTSAILGLSAGGLTAFSLYWNPVAMQTAYSIGSSKAGCIFANGKLLVTYVDDAGQLRDINGLFAASNQLVTARTNTIKSGFLSSDAPAGDSATANALLALKVAFDAAERAGTLLQSQRTAALASPAVVQTALSNTTSSVIAATRRQPATFAGVQTSVIDVFKAQGANEQVFADLRRQLAGRPAEPAKDEPVTVAEGAATPSPADLTADLLNSASSLLGILPPVAELNSNITACAPSGA